MACVNSNGELTQTAKDLLNSIVDEAQTPQDISKNVGQPIFKVRSSLRDMKSMGFVIEEDGKYKMNPKAKKVLEK